jgi:3-isopropylmalate/(R)-2-methylmalate dehydratase small subunit
VSATSGRAWVFGDNVDTDVIMPGRYCHIIDPKELASHVMEDLSDTFRHEVRPGDVVVAGENFGCGSSREVAPQGMQLAGVGAVIAKGYARIFFRNAINIGLPIFESPEAVAGIQEGDRLEVDPASGTIKNLTRGTSWKARELPAFVRQIGAAGGLMSYVKRKLEDRKLSASRQSQSAK